MEKQRIGSGPNGDSPRVCDSINGASVCKRLVTARIRQPAYFCEVRAEELFVGPGQVSSS